MAADRRLGGRRAGKALEALRDKGFNFDPEQREQFTTENGWKVNDYTQPLPPEPPGRPQPGGSFAVAQRLMRDYQFADPAIVRAIYQPDSPFERRDMLLEGRFYGLRFYLGVRVGGVLDEQRTVDGRPVKVWGWNYRTLQGHLEMGQMDYELWKWLDDGGVDFRIHAFSRPAHIPNPVVRLGFGVFGRWVQRRFARHACRRMALLTAASPSSAAVMEDLRPQAPELAVPSETVVPQRFRTPGGRCHRPSRGVGSDPELQPCHLSTGCGKLRSSRSRTKG